MELSLHYQGDNIGCQFGYLLLVQLIRDVKVVILLGDAGYLYKYEHNHCPIRHTTPSGGALNQNGWHKNLGIELACGNDANIVFLFLFRVFYRDGLEECQPFRREYAHTAERFNEPSSEI